MLSTQASQANKCLAHVFWASTITFIIHQTTFFSSFVIVIQPKQQGSSGAEKDAKLTFTLRIHTAICRAQIVNHRARQILIGVRNRVDLHRSGCRFFKACWRHQHFYFFAIGREKIIENKISIELQIKSINKSTSKLKSCVTSPWTNRTTSGLSRSESWECFA